MTKDPFNPHNWYNLREIAASKSMLVMMSLKALCQGHFPYMMHSSKIRYLFKIHVIVFSKKNLVIPLNASGSKSDIPKEIPNLRTNIQFKSKVHEGGVLNLGFLGPKP